MAILLRVCVLASALTYAVTPPGPRLPQWLLLARKLISCHCRSHSKESSRTCSVFRPFNFLFSFFFGHGSCIRRTQELHEHLGAVTVAGQRSLFSLASLLARQYLISAYVWGVVAFAEIGKLLSVLVLKGKGASLAHNSRPLSITAG